MDDRKLANGNYSVRLRCGKGARPWVEVATDNPNVAAARRLRLQNVAAACVRAGVPGDEILLMLRTLGEQRTEADFSKIERRSLQEAHDAANAPEAPPPKKLAHTFGELWALWLNGDLARDFPHKVGPIDPHTAKKARARLAAMPLLNKVALESITEDLADEAIGSLPEMEATTRAQHQALIRRVCKIAVKLRLLPSSPIPAGWCGSVKSSKTNCFLYPPEDLQLVSCPAIEFKYRLLWGFLDREGCRLDEALEATWAQVDLARGGFRIDKHKSRKKTGKSRHWVMEPGTTRALKWWFFELQRQGKAAPHMRVFAGLEDLDEKNAAALLRNVHLALAGLDRPEFQENNAERMWFHVHSLRVTFVTLALANKRTESEIMAKTGHATSGQLHDYDAGAGLVRVMGFTDFLTPLDEALGLTKGAADNDGSCDVRGAVPGSLPAGDSEEQTGRAGGTGATDASLAALRAGVLLERSAAALGAALGGDETARSEVLPALVSGADRDRTNSGAGRDRGGSMTHSGTPGLARVAQRVAQNSRSSVKDAGLGGLLQTPDEVNGQQPSPDFEDLRDSPCSSVQLGPPALGGMAQGSLAHEGLTSTPVSPALDAGQIPDAETALANAAAGAVAAGQWGLAKTFAALLEERQRARIAPGVASLEARRNKASSS